MTTPPRRFTLPPSHRIRHKRDFDAVYQQRVARHVGPLRVLAIPNDLAHHRLGLSVSRRVGNAVKRNRIKRLLRESFRLLQHDLPGAYDLVIVVRTHELQSLEDYQRMMSTAVQKLDRQWSKRTNV